MKTKRYATEHPIWSLKTGHGHWKINTVYRGKEISCVTTNSVAIDEYFNTDEDEKDGNEIVWLRGYSSLRSELIRKNKN